MTLPAANRRGRPSAGGLALRSLLSIVMLVPLSLIAVLGWQHTSEEGEFVHLEREGTEYFRALVPLETALVDAQATAVAGQPVPWESLDHAVQAVAALDARLGGDLRSSQRWGEARAKIEALQNPRSEGAGAVLASYAETTDVLLALFDKVRTSSKLILDPEADTYFLHDGVTQELPEAIAAAGGLVDLTVVIAGKSGKQRSAVLSDLLNQRVALAGNIDDLVDDVRSSVDSTASPTLGGALLGRLDRFRRVVDSILPATSALAEPSAAVDPASMAKSRTEAQAAAADLSQAMLRELDSLLAQRQSKLRNEVLAGAASVLAIVVLIVAGIVLDLVLRRRARRAGQQPAEGAGAPPQPSPLAWPGAAARLAPPPRPQPPPVTVPTGPPAGTAGGVEPDQWERYVASR